MQTVISQLVIERVDDRVFDQAQVAERLVAQPIVQLTPACHTARIQVPHYHGAWSRRGCLLPPAKGYARRCSCHSCLLPRAPVGGIPIDGYFLHRQHPERDRRPWSGTESTYRSARSRQAGTRRPEERPPLARLGS
jgi:hypothetical protein